MNEHTTNSISINHLPHCRHRTRTGRLCRLPALDAHSGLCFRHASLRDRQIDDGDLSAALLGSLTGFNSAADVNGFLSKLLFLLVQNRISTKRAAVLTYICAQLLRGFRAMDLETANLEAPGDSGPQQVLIDLLRPRREPVGNPS